MIDGRISFRKLEIFCLVVETGSVSEAARRLHLVQPAVSEHLRTLERHLGFKLLVRHGRGVQLTEAGARLHTWALEMLSRAHELDRELAGLRSGEQGSASVGASTTVGTYLLPPTIADFALTRPRARITLRTSTIQPAIDGALSGDFDFSVVAGQPTMTNVVVSPLLVESFVLVTGTAGSEMPERITAEELERLTFVCMVEDPERLSLIDLPLQRQGIGPRRVAVELGHPEAIKRTVERGLGVAFLLRAAVERELLGGSLREISVDVELLTQISLVHRAQRVFSPLQAELMSVISGFFAERATTLAALGAKADAQGSASGGSQSRT